MRTARWLVPAAAVGAIALAVWRRRAGRAPGARHYWRAKMPFRMDAVPGELERIGVRPGLRVLEVGCGPGVYTETAARMVEPGGALSAVDPVPEMVSLASRRLAAQGLDIEVAQADARKLPYADATFDLAYLVGALGGMADREDALREVRRVLRPDGVLAVTEHLADPAYLPASAVTSACSAAGFEPAESTGGAWDHTSRFRRPG
jgi:ubiquinone/menaquinone biosynthesis C-methylase UbiE